MKLFKCKLLSANYGSKPRLVWFEAFPEGEVVKVSPSLAFSDLKALRIEADNADLTDAQRKDADTKLKEFYQKAHDSKDANALKEWRTFKKWDDARYWQKERATFSTALESPEAHKVEANLHVNGRYTLVEDTNIFDGRGRPRGILFARDNVLIPLSKNVITINGAEYIKVKIEEEGKPFSALRRGLVLKSSIGGLTPVKVVDTAPVQVAKQEAQVKPVEAVKAYVELTDEEMTLNKLTAKLKTQLQKANDLNSRCIDELKAIVNENSDHNKAMPHVGKDGVIVDVYKKLELRYQKVKTTFDQVKANYAAAESTYDDMVDVVYKLQKRKDFPRPKLDNIVSYVGDYLVNLTTVNSDKTETEQLFPVVDEVLDHLKAL